MNLIYQQWSGDARPSAYAGARAMAQYAERIGADHVFMVREKPVLEVGKGSKFYDKFLPLWDGTQDHYDRVLIADTDIFPVAGLEENIFDECDADIWICTEPAQPRLRLQAKSGICNEQDERWADMVRREWGGEMPRENGLLKVYNAGLVLFCREGLRKARSRFISPGEYIAACNKYRLYPFYALDQNYLHAMMFSCGLKVKELDNEWNRYVHYQTEGRRILGIEDPRTPNTRMVHIQLRGADDWDSDTLHRVANLPQSEWKLP